MKKPTKKIANDKKQVLSQSQQWLIIALLVMILFLFACIVYGADLMWYANS